MSPTSNRNANASEKCHHAVSVLYKNQKTFLKKKVEIFRPFQQRSAQRVMEHSFRELNEPGRHWVLPC